MPRVSVIMAVDRPGADATRAVQHVLAQTLNGVELIMVGGAAVPTTDPRARFIEEPDRNPALRRNRGARAAQGQFLAFIDDDAFADPRWLQNAMEQFDARPDLVAVGGPDPGPADAPAAERISDLLLATPLIGSGIACHESRLDPFDIRAPHDLALVNLIVRKAIFDILGGFSEAIGYIGEDTDLIRRLMIVGTVAYSPDVVVHHRRRAFPLAFMAQRWRYRLKTGELLYLGGEAGESYRANKKLLLFLTAGTVFLLSYFMFPVIFLLLLMAYVVATYLLSAPKNRLPMFLTPFIPLFFAVHHTTYYAGILWGAFRARRSSRKARKALR